jgi:hypothetical protein
MRLFITQQQNHDLTWLQTLSIEDAIKRVNKTKKKELK